MFIFFIILNGEYLLYTYYSLLNAFQNTPSFLFFPMMDNSTIWGSLKYLLYNLSPVTTVALVTQSVWFLWN